LAEENAMHAPSMKDKMVETIQKLPPDATVEDAIERLLFLAKVERGLLFLAKVERGLREADEGKTIPHSEMKRRFTT